MPFYNLETKRLTRTGNTAVALAGLGGLLTATACGTGGEGTRDEGAASSASASRSPEASASVDTTDPQAAKIGKATLKKLVWPGTVELPSGCPVWSKDHHGPLEKTKNKDGKFQLLVMVDARLSADPDCNPETDSGAGAQRGASSESGAVSMPEIPELYHDATHVADGVVARVNRYTTVGENTCQANGTNETRTWVEVQIREQDPLVWMPIAHTSYEPDVADMKHAGIPEAIEQAVYAGTGQGGCPSS
jgi:hypothetical protein